MIEFKNVSKKYSNGAYALKDINLKINKGEFVFIVGHSGAGKSTFLKMILREEVPTDGTVLVNNINTTKIKKRDIPHLRRSLGIVFQDFRLIPSKTVYDNVAFALRVIDSSNKAIKKRVPYILSLVGLSHKARCYPSELSGGEQQRVALARALINNPSIIIADEPTGNIDPEMSYEIIELLEEINKVGTTVIIVTHEKELVDKFNKRLITISNGKIKDDISHNPIDIKDEAMSEIKNYFTSDNVNLKHRNVEKELYDDVTDDDMEFVYKKYNDVEKHKENTTKKGTNKQQHNLDNERIFSTIDLIENVKKNENSRNKNIQSNQHKKIGTKNVNEELLKNNKSISYDNLSLEDENDLFCMESEKEDENK